MKILAFNTSTEYCSVALQQAHKKLSYVELCTHKHTQYILPLIQRILQKSNMSLRELDFLAFSYGPGSFVGIRVGITIAQGLALGSDLPLVGISTFEILAQAAWSRLLSPRVLIAINTNIGHVYWSVYQRNHLSNWQRQQNEIIIKPTDILERMKTLTGKWTCVGTGWKTYPELTEKTNLDLFISDIEIPHAEDMLPLAKSMFLAGSTILPENIEPKYLSNAFFS
ncbi:tRNA (adenosine(37)-N6)-threonylcarbamoyltransferase complex dimerization subunit type 1 TsaB [Candidatus Erwinia haradaeae]|uniref:tRNA threonylcarbamoyladenosine biosynthesis protein TsaB n=1 Tax=Candidatus Erwinia haradaeae TaxID=1922217 RepID=A0A451DP16_9GAMM|nr:tRNA (adenosine(37)-N6)-threonylcarbamoyltransferase complex dimerization subunit type 1 TsaB [Candidatus Erwinia haradaeae]VFP88519.1 tRNA threonylcarbamoyladenosine biosynthesis protein TsaB [Candidatus Erwinia haradaeae]